MTGTAHARSMAAVVAELHPLLRDAGFRKRRQAFNRETELGRVQGVDFQMGRHQHAAWLDDALLRGSSRKPGRTASSSSSRTRATAAARR